MERSHENASPKTWPALTGLSDQAVAVLLQNVMERAELEREDPTSGVIAFNLALRSLLEREEATRRGTVTAVPLPELPAMKLEDVIAVRTGLLISRSGLKEVAAQVSQPAMATAIRHAAAWFAELGARLQGKES